MSAAPALQIIVPRDVDQGRVRVAWLVTVLGPAAALALTAVPFVRGWDLRDAGEAAIWGIGVAVVLAVIGRNALQRARGDEGLIDGRSTDAGVELVGPTSVRGRTRGEWADGETVTWTVQPTERGDLDGPTTTVWLSRFTGGTRTIDSYSTREPDDADVEVLRAWLHARGVALSVERESRVRREIAEP